MGGRGSKYSASAQSPQPATATQAAPQSAAGGGAGMGNGQLIQNQVPDANNTPAIPDVTGTLANMTDDQLAALMNQSKTIDMPNHLNDAVDATQKFVYASGANGMPTVLDDTQFSQFMKANNISQSDVMARSVGGADYTINNVHVHLSPDQITQMMKYSQLNYVGGKHGGNVYGSGTYFDKNGGRNTGYERRSGYRGSQSENCARHLQEHTGKSDSGMGYQASEIRSGGRSQGNSRQYQHLRAGDGL